MATIIRSDVTLSDPQPGALLLPTLGVTGATHRWHAESVAGTPGSPVALIPDSIGNAPMNVLLAGAVSLGETAGGRRFIDLGAGEGDASFQNRIAGPASGDSNDEFSLVALAYWEKFSGGTSYGILNSSTTASTQGISLDGSNNKISAYGGGSGSLILGTPNSPIAKGWHTAVVSYRKNGDEAISLDGGTIAKGDVHNVNAAISVSQFGMSGRPEHKVRVIDYAFIPRALTDAEHRQIHSALAAQIPA